MEREENGYLTYDETVATIPLASPVLSGSLRVLPRFYGHLVTVHNGPGRGVMAQRRRFSAEYKREAVVMLESPGVSISQIATEMQIGVTVLWW